MEAVFVRVGRERRSRRPLVHSFFAGCSRRNARHEARTGVGEPSFLHAHAAHVQRRSAFLFVFIALALEALFPASGAMLWAAGGGPWGLVVSWSAVESCLYPGETRRLFFLPWDIPARMYPVALAVLIVLFGMGGGGQGGGAFLGIPVALLAGFLFAEEDYNELEPSRSQGAFLRFLAPSTTRLQQWESSSLCAWLVNMDGYVRVGDALGRRAYDASTTSSGGWGAGGFGGGAAVTTGVVARVAALRRARWAEGTFSGLGVIPPPGKERFPPSADPVA